jgi:hypothetical protein
VEFAERGLEYAHGVRHSSVKNWTKDIPTHTNDVAIFTMTISHCCPSRNHGSVGVDVDNILLIVSHFVFSRMVPSKFRGDMGVATMGSDVTVIQSLGIHLITTFLFVLTFFATVDPNRPTLGSQPLAVGLSMMLGHLVGVSYIFCFVFSLDAGVRKR